MVKISNKGEFPLSWLKDPRILSLARKVTLEVNPESGKKPSLNVVEVVAGGKTYRGERLQPMYGRGGEQQLDDRQLAEKFKGNAANILSQKQINKAIKSLLDLEKMPGTGELMKQVKP